MSPSPVLSSLSEQRVCGPTASLFGRGGITSLLFFISVVLPLCVAWAVTLTGSFFFVRAEGLRPYCFLVWEGWHQRWSSSLCSTYSYALHWYWSIWHGLLGYIWINIFVVTLYLGGQDVACGLKVIFISLFYKFLCTTLALVYLAWSPWVYLDIHIRGYIIFWWPSYCLWLKFQSTMQHSTLGYRALIQPTTILVYKVALNTQPSWLGVCVYLLKRSKTCTWSLRNSHEALVYLFQNAGGQGLQWWPCLTKLVTGGEAKSDQLRVPATSTWTWWSNYVWLGSFLVFLFQAVASN